MDFERKIIESLVTRITDCKRLGRLGTKCKSHKRSRINIGCWPETTFWFEFAFRLGLIWERWRLFRIQWHRNFESFHLRSFGISVWIIHRRGNEFGYELWRSNQVTSVTTQINTIWSSEKKENFNYFSTTARNEFWLLKRSHFGGCETASRKQYKNLCEFSILSVLLDTKLCNSTTSLSGVSCRLIKCSQLLLNAKLLDSRVSGFVLR